MTSRIRVRPAGLRYALTKFAKITFLVMLFYLVQSSVVPHLKLWGIIPNLYMICAAILTVSYGKKYAFACGAVFGILLEVMLPSLPILNLVIYPALTLLCAQIFADMSEIKRELLRIKIAQRQAESRIIAVGGVEQKKWYHLDFRRKTADDMEPHLRIILNALMLTLLYDLVMLAYFALEGVSIGFNHVLRMLQSLFYTALWCAAMFPARLFLGFYPRLFKRNQREDGLGDEVTTSDKLLRELSLAPDLPNIVAAFDTAPVIKEEKETVSAQLDASGTDKTSTDLQRASSDSDEEEETPGKETRDEV